MSKDLIERLVAIETENNICAEDRKSMWMKLGEMDLRIGRHKEKMNDDIRLAFEKLDEKMDLRFASLGERIKKVEWALIALIAFFFTDMARTILPLLK